MNTTVSRFLRHGFALGALLAGVGLSAQVIVFDAFSLAPGVGGVTNRVDFPAVSAFQRFTVAGTGADVEIQQVQWRVGGAASWSATLELWSDNGGTPLTTGDTPGSLLQTFDNVTGVDGTVTVTFTGSMMVTPGTSYWLHLRPDAGEANLGYAGAFAGGSSGAAGTWLTSNDYIAYYEVFGSYAMAGSGGSVFGVAITAVPEPSTYAAVAGLGALGFAAWRRRRFALT